jgi:hypothetical protein
MKKRWIVLISATILGLWTKSIWSDRPASTGTKGAAEDPLGEWYEFGFSQGKQLRIAHQILGRSVDPSRTQMAHLLTNLGCDIHSVEQTSFEQSYAGLVDGLTGTPAKFCRPRGQSGTILPSHLRGYNPSKQQHRP